MTSTIEEQISKNGYLVYKVKGVSMYPLLHDTSDVVTILRKENYFKNDAVLFKRKNGQYVLHRIKKVCLDKFFIIGDNCVTGEWVPRDSVLGVMTKINRNGISVPLNGMRYSLYIRTRWIRRVYLYLRRIFRKILLGRR